MFVANFATENNEIGIAYNKINLKPNSVANT